MLKAVRTFRDFRTGTTAFIAGWYLQHVLDHFEYRTPMQKNCLSEEHNLAGSRILAHRHGCVGLAELVQQASRRREDAKMHCEDPHSATLWQAACRAGLPLQGPAQDERCTTVWCQRVREVVLDHLGANMNLRHIPVYTARHPQPNVHSHSKRLHRQCLSSHKTPYTPSFSPFQHGGAAWCRLVYNRKLCVPAQAGSDITGSLCADVSHGRRPPKCLA